MLQDIKDVFVNDSCFDFDVPNRNFLPICVRKENLDDSSGPKVQICAVTKIGKRSLRATRFILNHRQAIRHLDQDFSVAIPLRKWHNHDARQIIGFRIGVPKLLLREITNKVPTIFFDLAENIKQEWLNRIL